MGKVIKYDYNFRGTLAWRQDGNGRITKFQYDMLDRLVSVTDANDLVLVSMDYDVLGNVTRVASTNSVFEYKYDALNRATNAVCLLTNLPGFATVKYAIDYAFDPVGNVTNRLITGLAGMSGTIATRYQYDVMIPVDERGATDEQRNDGERVVSIRRGGSPREERLRQRRRGQSRV